MLPTAPTSFLCKAIAPRISLIGTGVDLYFEDAVHKNPILQDNIVFWRKFLTADGIVCGHDSSKKFKDVRRAATALSKEMDCRLFNVESFWCLLRHKDLKANGEVARVARTLQTLADRVVKEHCHELTPDNERYAGKRGETVRIAGKIKNITEVSWPIAAGQYSVKGGARIVSCATGEKVKEVRCPLHAPDLPPGEAIDFEYLVETDSLKPGEYRVEMDLVIDHAYWFAAKGATPKNVVLTIV